MNVDGGKKRKIRRNKAVVLLHARKTEKQGRREDKEEEDNQETDDDVLPVVGKKRQGEVTDRQNKGHAIKVTSQRKRTAEKKHSSVPLHPFAPLLIPAHWLSSLPVSFSLLSSFSG